MGVHGTYWKYEMYRLKKYTPKHAKCLLYKSFSSTQVKNCQVIHQLYSNVPGKTNATKSDKSILDPVEQEHMQCFFLCVATLTAESSKYPCTRLPMSKAPIIMKITNITIDQNKEDKKHWPGSTQRWNSKCQILKKYLLYKSKKSRKNCDRNVPPLVPQQTWKGAKPPARYM